MDLIMESVAVNPPVSPNCVIVLQPLPAPTMTSCCGSCEACSGDQAGGFLGTEANLTRVWWGEPFSSAICWTPGSALMWLGSGFSGFYIVLLPPLTQITSYCWKKIVRNVALAFPQDYFKKRATFYHVFFFFSFNEKNKLWWKMLF